MKTGTDETWLEISQPFGDPYNGNEKEISDWMKDVVAAMREYAKQQRRKHAR